MSKSGVDARKKNNYTGIRAHMHRRTKPTAPHINAFACTRTYRRVLEVGSEAGGHSRGLLARNERRKNGSSWVVRVDAGSTGMEPIEY